MFSYYFYPIPTIFFGGTGKFDAALPALTNQLSYIQVQVNSSISYDDQSRLIVDNADGHAPLNI